MSDRHSHFDKNKNRTGIAFRENVGAMRLAKSVEWNPRRPGELDHQFSNLAGLALPPLGLIVCWPSFSSRPQRSKVGAVTMVIRDSMAYPNAFPNFGGRWRSSGRV